MIEVTCWKTADGQLFMSENEAQDHEDWVNWLAFVRAWAQDHVSSRYEGGIENPSAEAADALLDGLMQTFGTGGLARMAMSRSRKS